MVSIDEEAIEASELPWDDVVDVICAGAGAGVLAHAIRCADLDLVVDLADMELSSQTSDPDTAAYLQSMTDDLDPGTARNLTVATVYAEPVTVTKDRKASIEPFYGSRLRDWSARCVVSPFGVIYSQIPETMTAMRTKAGESIQAAVLGEYRPAGDRPGVELADWLREQARERGFHEHAGTALQRLIFEGGRVAGAELATPEGAQLVRANVGVALSIGPMPDPADWPVQADLPAGPARVVVTSRTASRFGRVELLYG
ncbi:hypothetical protein [Mycolicibacterium sphagni]|uniref:Uncharacterized protein n=1 Tax=Mycolicibacterium sphagni TaxID=1786 RepID=A0A255DGV6_9MYCO|nr:hypothetical protein [Mycolicibacterium sphagni]MCV7178737.1 hypothetical protein [Mycolicibacterium sphagni]OYN78616.1 hypothetical protein CG716_14495 [Mycolicibacterium sphagni]